ncbi:MAG: hypothetical protein HWQ38_01030 [Nostoc sp. NMS7]|uniref:hypothetical protein n=1 Tax=Nostoc sp. NMS7 TaxID=2815391 RepID=UPI0025E84C41|nr:hypothetical protein [Nostoc sp. NMS7]MBN3945138.1 hypothetical protein [Nostoc sp. NMS7]
MFVDNFLDIQKKRSPQLTDIYTPVPVRVKTLILPLIIWKVGFQMQSENLILSLIIWKVGFQMQSENLILSLIIWKVGFQMQSENLILPLIIWKVGFQMQSEKLILSLIIWKVGFQMGITVAKTGKLYAKAEILALTVFNERER